MKYRKKPVVIEVYQLPGAGEDTPQSFHDWCDRVGFIDFESGRDETLIIRTLEGDMTAQPGDWIIKGVKGEFYPCKPDIFAATYEPADGQTFLQKWSGVIKSLLMSGQAQQDDAAVDAFAAAMKAKLAEKRAEGRSG